MARKYDIIARLKAKNERPFVMIDEEHNYTIDTSKTNVMAILAVTNNDKKNDKDDYESDAKMIDKIIELALGKSALEYISSKNYTMAVYEDIMNVIMATISDKDLEEVEKEEKK